MDEAHAKEVQRKYIGGNMEKLQYLTYQEKEQLCAHLGKMYRKGMFHTGLVIHGMVMDQLADDADIDVAAHLRMILLRMDQRYALIILNDFLEIKEGGWWKEYYSRSSYYRYKKLAVDALLAQLYMEKG